MVLNTNKIHTTIASIIYEIYKLKLKKPDNTIEEIFLDMFNNQKYDNLYQYNISDNEINHTIKHSLLFAQSLSILDDILSFNKFNSNKNIFSHVCSDLENYISGDSTTYIENKNLNKFNVKKLIKIFSLLDIKFRDDKECLEIKRK